MGLKENIKQKRLEENLTLEELAKKVGKTKQTVQKYESGVITNIPSNIIERLAEALHTTPGYLMGWSEDEKSLASFSCFNDLTKSLGYMIRPYEAGNCKLRQEENYDSDGILVGCEENKLCINCESYVKSFTLTTEEGKQYFLSFDDYMRLKNEILSYTCYKVEELIKHKSTFSLKSNMLNVAHAVGTPTEEDDKKTEEIMDNDENCRTSGE